MSINRETRAALLRAWPPESITAYKQRLPKIDYGVLYAVFADLALAQAWSDVTIHNLDGCRPLISGLNRGQARRYVYALRADEKTSLKSLNELFKAVQGKVGMVTTLLLGIVHTDSTVVYYTLNEGIVKPTVN